jgi:5-methylcytosine-specific restriction endonuclease McrA
MDLKADHDRFLMETEDHLVPTSVGGKDRNIDNLILSCVICNRLKANFVPSGIDVKKDRRAYIAAVRKHIFACRSDRLAVFMQVTHPDQPDYQ